MEKSYRRTNGSETFDLNAEKLILHEKITPLFHWRREMSLLTGKIEKAHLVRDCFFLPERRNPAIFFKLGTWRAAKTGACLLRSSGGTIQRHAKQS